jgi:hypothetical protein
MMRNDEVVQRFLDGRTARNRNLAAEDGGLRSYWTTIAFRLPNGVVAYDSSSYSSTTNRHLSEVSYAMRGRLEMPPVAVPFRCLDILEREWRTKGFEVIDRSERWDNEAIGPYVDWWGSWALIVLDGRYVLCGGDRGKTAGGWGRTFHQLFAAVLPHPATTIHEALVALWPDGADPTTWQRQGDWFFEPTETKVRWKERATSPFYLGRTREQEKVIALTTLDLAGRSHFGTHLSVDQTMVFGDVDHNEHVRVRLGSKNWWRVHPSRALQSVSASWQVRGSAGYD